VHELLCSVGGAEDAGGDEATFSEPLHEVMRVPSRFPRVAATELQAHVSQTRS
jgi:hypothetical protein